MRFLQTSLMGLIATLVLASNAQAIPLVIDFETDAGGSPIVAGQIIDDEYAAFGLNIFSNNQAIRPTIAFDTSNPTGGDDDLGTPNEDFGGPGSGSGGGAGQPGQNDTPLGNVLIISEDGDQSDPDDNAGGGTISFVFDNAVSFFSIGILDVDGQEAAGVINLLNSGGGLIAALNILPLGDNSVQLIDDNYLGVSRIDVVLPKSGAVTGLEFETVPEPSSLALLLLGGAALIMRKRTA